MKRRVLSGILGGIGVLALSTTAAYAGAGGIPSPLTSFFVCQSITGDDAGVRVDVNSSALGTNPTNVRVGNATLACAFAKLFQAGTGTEIEPNPSKTHEGLKCYSISVSKQGTVSPPTRFNVTDQLLGTDPDVHASSLQYICAPATFTQ